MDVDKNQLMSASEYARYAGIRPRRAQYWAQKGWVKEAQKVSRPGSIVEVVEAPLWAWEKAATYVPKRGWPKGKPRSNTEDTEQDS